MYLKDAVLCVQCEWVFENNSSCPQCGCLEGYPLSRAMNRKTKTVTNLRQLSPPKSPVVSDIQAAGKRLPWRGSK